MNLQKLFLVVYIYIVPVVLTAQTDTSLTHKTLLSKALGFISQSQLMYLVEKYTQKPLYEHVHKLVPIGDEEASLLYQELGKEAQVELGIPQNHFVPIKKIMPTSPYAHIGGAAYAEPAAIYVNEGTMDKRSYGAQRCALFHEAVHEKYHDSASDTVYELVGLIGSSLITHKLIQVIKPQGRFKFLHGLGVALAGLSVASYMSSKYHHFMERRADIEGHYTTQCSACVHEAAVQRRITFEVENNPLKNNGYLSADELEKIVSDLGQQNKLCAHHKNVLEQSENS